METDRLQMLGFSRVESKIYLALLKSGPLSAGRISKKIGVNRRTTYDALERLMKKGHVSYIMSSAGRVFRPANPATIIKEIKDREKLAMKLMPKLQDMFRSSKENSQAEIYAGRSGIRNILREILNEKAYAVFGSNENFPRIMKHDFYLFQKEKKERCLRSRTILSISMKNKPILKEAFTTYRFIPSRYSLPTSTFIYGRKVAIVVWSEQPYAIVIADTTVFKSFKRYFEALWKVCEPERC